MRKPTVHVLVSIVGPHQAPAGVSQQQTTTLARLSLSSPQPLSLRTTTTRSGGNQARGKQRHGHLRALPTTGPPKLVFAPTLDGGSAPEPDDEIGGGTLPPSIITSKWGSGNRKDGFIRTVHECLRTLMYWHHFCGWRSGTTREAAMYASCLWKTRILTVCF
jgi:hypothetical protein